MKTFLLYFQITHEEEEVSMFKVVNLKLKVSVHFRHTQSYLRQETLATTKNISGKSKSFKNICFQVYSLCKI